uniref:Uncharacterized protein n=1 Tax=Arundo donax TaxID=35708 RepID=A0A0A8Z376_ARUDO
MLRNSFNSKTKVHISILFFPQLGSNFIAVSVDVEYINIDIINLKLQKMKMLK